MITSTMEHSTKFFFFSLSIVAVRRREANPLQNWMKAVRKWAQTIEVNSCLISCY